MSDERTIEVGGFFGKKLVTREQFVRRWVDHAAQLHNIGLSVVDETRARAEIMFDKFWSQENPE